MEFLVFVGYQEIYLSEYLLQSYKDGLGLHDHPAIHDKDLARDVGSEV